MRRAGVRLEAAVAVNCSCMRSTSPTTKSNQEQETTRQRQITKGQRR